MNIQDLINELMKPETDEGIKAIKLICQEKLESLNLDDQNLDDNAIEKLLKGLNKNSSLQHLSLADNKFTAKGLSSIIKFLASNKNIVTLDLSENDFSKKEDADIIIELIKKNTTIKELILNEVRISPQRANEVAGALQQNTNSAIRVLHLEDAFDGENNKTLDNEAVGKAIATLITDKRITKLNVLQNEITADASLEIGEALKNNSTLKTLAIGDYFTVKTLKPLLEALKGNTTLQEFTLDSSYVNSDEMRLLSDALRNNNTLRSLRLNHINNLDDCGYNDDMSDDEYDDGTCVDTNKNKINLDYTNEIDRDQASGINSCKMAELRKVFIKNKSIVTLDLSNSFVNDNSAAIIGLFLNENRTLETLILTDNLLNKKGLGYIADGLENNLILTQLEIDTDCKNSQEYKRIQTILLRNKNHYIETLKNQIDKFDKLIETYDKSLEDFCKNLYGLKVIYEALPRENEYNSPYRAKIIEKLYTVITNRLNERINSDAFKTDTKSLVLEYVNTLKLIYKDDDKCKTLLEKLNSQINILALDDGYESRGTEKSSLKRANNDYPDKANNIKQYKNS